MNVLLAGDLDSARPLFQSQTSIPLTISQAEIDRQGFRYPLGSYWVVSSHPLWRAFRQSQYPLQTKIYLCGEYDATAPIYAEIAECDRKKVVWVNASGANLPVAELESDYDIVSASEVAPVQRVALLGAPKQIRNYLHTEQPSLFSTRFNSLYELEIALKLQGAVELRSADKKACFVLLSTVRKWKQLREQTYNRADKLFLLGKLSVACSFYREVKASGTTTEAWWINENAVCYPTARLGKILDGLAESPTVVAEPPAVVAEPPAVVAEPPVVAVEPPVVGDGWRPITDDEGQHCFAGLSSDVDWCVGADEIRGTIRRQGVITELRFQPTRFVANTVYLPTLYRGMEVVDTTILIADYCSTPPQLEVKAGRYQWRGGDPEQFLQQVRKHLACLHC
jgi:hypothetical protein